MKWRRGVASADLEKVQKLGKLGEVGHDLSEANKAVRDPTGYAINKVETMFGVHDLTPEQIANEQQRRSNMSDLPAPNRSSRCGCSITTPRRPSCAANG